MIVLLNIDLPEVTLILTDCKPGLLLEIIPDAYEGPARSPSGLSCRDMRFATDMLLDGPPLLKKSVWSWSRGFLFGLIDYSLCI